MHEARTAKENTDTIEDVTQKFPWKKYEELTFADDFMFCKVLTDRPDLCQEMVEIITGRKVREVRNLVPQRSQKEYYDGKTSIFLNASSSKMLDGELERRLLAPILLSILMKKLKRSSMIIMEGGSICYTETTNFTLIESGLNQPDSYR